jgi:5'-deoxynucleotidase YfbR-like HD superfamily hydrolase
MNKSDWAFITDIDGRFPEKGIEQSIGSYGAIPKPHRLAYAWEKAGDMKRAGYVRRGVPEDRQQSNRNHCRYVGKLAVEFNPFGQHTAIRQLMEMAIDHDRPEVVVNADFTPADNDRISKNEKMRLETIGAGLLFTPARFSRWQEQEARATPRAQWIGDCDLLEIGLDVTCAIEQKYPELKPKLDGFFDSIDRGVKTATGRRVFDELLKSRDHLHKTGKSLGLCSLRDDLPLEEGPGDVKDAEIYRIKRVLGI